MKSLARNSKLALLGLTGLLALPVSADNIGIYGGLQGGYSNPDTNDDIIELEDDKVISAYAGYKFLNWLGAEAGYAQLGKFDIEEEDDEDSEGSTPYIKMQSLYAALTLWGPLIGPLNAYAKLGAHYTETELHTSTIDDDPADEPGDEDSDYDEGSYGLFYEVGMEIPVVEHFSITVSYQNFHNIELLHDIDYGDGEDFDLGDAGVDIFNVGARFEF